MEFAGIDAKALKKQLATGKGDGEILDWVKQNCETAVGRSLKSKPGQRGRSGARLTIPIPANYFNSLHKQVAPERTDITSWFDLLDVDDFGSYGGKV